MSSYSGKFEMSNKPKRQEEKNDKDKDVVLAKISYRNTIIVAILGLIGTIITAYFGYLSTQSDPSISTNNPTKTITTTPISNPKMTTTAIPTNTITINPTNTITPIPLQIFSTLPVQISDLTSNFPRDPSTGFVVIYPACGCNYDLKQLDPVDARTPVIIRLRWGAKTAELAESGADSVIYSLSINGKAVNNIDQYRRSAVYVNEPTLMKDFPESWWVYWDYPLRTDSYIENSIYSISVDATINTSAEINNGWEVVPEGYNETLLSTLELRKPAQID